MFISETIPSQLKLIPGLISSVIEKLGQLPLDAEIIFSVKIVLHEALINAIKHGNKMNSGLSVKVDIVFKPEQLTIQVTDQGEGYDYKNIPDPTEPQNLEKLKGRGIFLIKHAMDKVEFENQGRTIRMIKYLNQEG